MNRPDKLYEAQRRHALHYAQVLESADDLYRAGHEQMMQGLALFEIESSNIKSGQTWAENNADRDKAAAHLCIFYAYDGAAILPLRFHPRESIKWFMKSVMSPRRLKHRPAESIALGNLGNAYDNLGEYQRAIDCLEQALAVARGIGDRLNESASLDSMGLAYKHLGEYSRAIDYHEQALKIACEIGDRDGEGRQLGHLGTAYNHSGEYRRAIKPTSFLDGG